MPEHERPRHRRVADRTLGEPVQVGTAHPDRRDLDEPFVSSVRHRAVLVVKADVSGGVQT
ncbi:hypothetical protein Aab01nite_79240 [Paractinoplanes abujensis]|nr:hypothetical protein Aab01nite_79240 [Actinoplanes abujensis]